MEYLAEVKIEDVKYESHVDVREYDGELEVEFCTGFGFINDTVEMLNDIPESVQEMLLDEGADMYRMDDGADAAYDAMRDA